MYSLSEVSTYVDKKHFVFIIRTLLLTVSKAGFVLEAGGQLTPAYCAM